MSWLGFGKKGQQSPKSKGKKKRYPRKTFILEEIITPSVMFPVLSHDSNPLQHLLDSLPHLHLGLMADGGACPVAPPTDGDLPPLIQLDFLGLIEAPTPTPGTDIKGLFETLPKGVIFPIDPPGNTPKDSDVDPSQFALTAQPLIGIIDTGFSGNNSDLNQSRVTLGRDRVSNDDNPLLSAGEGNEHGTFIEGIIGASRNNGVGIDGINDQAPMWVGRAIGSGKWADSLVEFVDAVKKSGQPNGLVNLSLDLTQQNPDGSVTTRYEFTPEERAAIEYARQNHVLIVAAAGNDGGVMSVLGQASQEFDNILTVGASDGNNRAAYSSYGRGLDIMAVGGTTENPELSLTGDGVGTMAGTSVATAKVTGAASLVWAANPELNYRQVIEILKSTAKDLSDPGWDEETGAGLLDMVAAVEKAKATTPQEYDVLATVIPETWSGEGKVTPLERASQTMENFRLRIWPSDGVNLRNSPNYNDRGPVSLPQNTWLNFDAWTWGSVNIDPANGRQDALYYRTWYNGKAYWVPSIWIDGYPPSRPPLLPPVASNPNTVAWREAIDAEYQETKNLLGNPISDYFDAARSPQGTSGKFRNYQNGTIHWSPQYGAVAIWYDLQREYTEYSSPNGSGGWLGFPTKREYPWNGGKRTNFEGGYIFWDGQRAKAYPSTTQANSTPTSAIINAVNKVNPDQWYYRPRDITGDRINETFCNWFAADVLDQLGVPIPRNGPSAGSYTKPHPIYGTNTPNKPFGTDQLLNFFNGGGNGLWEKVSAADAVSSANNGQVVLASNAGHIAVVIPGGSGSNVRIAQAGATNGKDMSVDTGFGSQTRYYFRYKGSVTPSTTSNNSNSYSPPATPGQQRQYIIKPGDTLSGIAQRELGNANRWREIQKPGGGTFTEAEARQLRVGQSVYLPVSYQTGTGNPSSSITSPSSAPKTTGLPKNAASASIHFRKQPPNSADCGPSSLAMTLSALGVTPSDVSGVRAKMPELNKSPWTDFDEIEGGIKNFGKSPTTFRDWTNFDSHLSQGHPLVMFGLSSPTWAAQFPGGHPGSYVAHFIAILGKTNDGKYIVCDPLYSKPVEMDRNQLKAFIPNQTYYYPNGGSYNFNPDLPDAIAVF